MKENIENVSDTRVNLTCVFEKNEIQAEKDLVINEFCKEANIPGFRKGKVPRNIITSKFHEAIEKQLRSALADKTIKSLDAKEDLDVSTIVDVKVEDSKDGAICTLVLDVVPSFTLPDYRSIKVDSISVSVADNEVEGEIKNILRQHAKYEIVNRKAKVGDFVKLSYVGSFEDGSNIVDDKSIPTIYGSQANTWEEAGSEISPGVRCIIDGIIGTKAGDEKSVSQTFDKNFEISALAGKTVTYALKIVEIRECIIPELSGELLKNFAVKTVEELKEKVKSALFNHKTSQARFNQRETIVSKICEMTEVKIPEGLIDQDAAELAGEFMGRQLSHGANFSDMQARSNEVFSNLRPISGKRVKAGIILDKIAKQEKIEVSKEDVEQMIWQDVNTKKVDANRYIDSLKKDNNKLADLRRRTLRGKTLDYLMTVLCSDLQLAPTSEMA